MKSKRITQKDIALAANVHPATVSLALKNHYSIPADTRDRIQKAARELGYAPDPMLTALAKYRMEGAKQTYKGVLAWFVNNSIAEYDWRASPHYHRWFEGAKSQAALHGFEVEIIEFSSGKMRSERMASILRARNIQGVLLCPQPEAFTRLDFPWSDFSVVTFGSTLIAPRLHTVATAHYQSVRDTFDTLWQRGYRRIGCTISQSVDNRCANLYLSSYLGKSFLHGYFSEIPPLYEDYNWMVDPGDLARWCKRYKLDAVISNNHLLHQSLADGGLSAPEQIGAACPSLPDTDSDLSGIFESSIHIGEVAVDFLVGMIYRGERGIPRYPQRLSVEGVWHEGKTIRASAEA